MLIEADDFMSFRVLVVEDEPEIADFIVRGLGEEGFIVERAADGEEGWTKFCSGEWNLVLLDWWLPRVDGLTLLSRLREKGDSTPVLFLTARDAVAERVRGLDVGADDYLCKPFAFEELLARVRALTRRPASAPTSILIYQDLRVDLVSRRVERGGVRIDLTAKEESLLVYLMRRPGEVLSRTRIYDSVWDERYDGVSNTLEVHVMELRRKLESHGDRIIHTVRGRGYRFGEHSQPAPPPKEPRIR